MCVCLCCRAYPLPPLGNHQLLTPLPWLLVLSSSSGWSEDSPSLRPSAPTSFGSSPGSLDDSMEGTAAPLSPIVKAGWLDKNPPQG